MQETILNRIRVTDDDITRVDVDAIVNAANSALSGGGGADGAIHRAAGPGLLAECRGLGRCPTGEAVATAGYDLSATWVIHAVGPVWSGGSRDEEAQLASAYRAALSITRRLPARTVAFPAISCGAYRYPIPAAARIAIRTIASFMDAASAPSLVLVCCIERTVRVAFEKAHADLAQEIQGEDL